MNLSFSLHFHKIPKTCEVVYVSLGLFLPILLKFEFLWSCCVCRSRSQDKKKKQCVCETALMSDDRLFAKHNSTTLLLLLVARVCHVTSNVPVIFLENGVYSSLFRGKASGGHSKGRETRDAQFLQKVTRFALTGVGPARPRPCKCPPPQIPVSQSPF